MINNRSQKTVYDVIVCGGGPAGIGVAIAAARHGAKANFWIDLHDSPPGQDFTTYDDTHKSSNRPAEGDWFDIPLRCLIPKGLDGILVAGRCISADREVQAATRMIPTCMYTGSAAGNFAANAAKSRKTSRSAKNLGK